MAALNLLYLHANFIGYGRMGVNVARELDARGVDVYDHLYGSDAPHAATDGRRTGRANTVCWLSVPTHATGWWKGQTAHIFTMWEAMRLPESFRDNLHHFKTVMVPSTHNLELFSDYHDNVKYVPLGIDPAVWHYTERPPTDRYFKFLIGGSGRRKGTDLAVKAFKTLWGEDRSWGDGPIPILMMKNPKGEVHYGPRLEQHTGRLTDAEEVELYEEAHCYLQPSRGEGFGLQPLQAMAQGIPTILTDAHGHKAFADLGIPIGWKPSKADYFVYGEAGQWWEPSFDDLVDAMREVYNNYEVFRADAERISHYVCDTLNWGRTTDKLLTFLGGPHTLGPYAGPEEWYAPETKHFKIITNRNWPCEIAGHQFFFERGKEFWQSSDVKRILFEAGVLDPACLDDDDPDASGLTRDQLAKAGKYRAEHSDCPTCGRPLEARA